MAYLSSTTTSPNVPYLVTQGIAYSSSNVTGTAGVRTGHPRTWHYNSTHISSDIEAANFFTDGKDLGFAVGDLLIHSEQASDGVTTAHKVITVGSTTTDIGVGTTIGLGA